MRPETGSSSTPYLSLIHICFDNIDPIAIREALEERGIVNGQVADSEKLDNDPFIQQAVSYTHLDVYKRQMETAGKEDMPEDDERKGLGTPATRAGIL